MTKKFDNNMRIALFKNPKFDEDKVKNPVMRGILEIDGVEYTTSLWARTYTDKDGVVQKVWRGEVQKREVENQELPE